MPEISLPTKANQDAIKLQTDKITDVKSKTDLIGAANPTTADTSTIMNYLKHLENKISNISGGTDWSKYISFNKGEVSVPLRSSSKEGIEILNITGGGYLSYIGVKYSSTYANELITLKVTVDGKTMLSSLLMKDVVGGIYNIDQLEWRSENSSLNVSDPKSRFARNILPEQISELPYINDTNAKYTHVVLYNPLFFKKNLVIQIFYGSYGYNFTWEARGGIG